MQQTQKAFEVELRNVQRLARKQAMEFFKQKSEHVIQLFKFEQMYMVEVHQNLRKSYTQQEYKLHRAQRTIAHQERIIKENRAIMYDCLNSIFKVVSTKKDHIVQSL